MSRGRIALVLALAMIAAACGDPPPYDSETAAESGGPGHPVRQVDEALSERPEGVISVEGTLSIEDDEPARLCRNADFGGQAITCPATGSLTVTDLDLDAVPRLSRLGSVRFAWPPIVLEGRLVDGTLEVTEMPEVFRIALVEPDDGSVFLDQSGRSPTVQLTPGQEVGLVNQEWTNLPTITVEDGPGALHLSQPECPSGGSCIAGFVAIDTSDLEAGTYQFAHEGTSVTLEAVVDDAPGASTTPWSVPVDDA